MAVTVRTSNTAGRCISEYTGTHVDVVPSVRLECDTIVTLPVKRYICFDLILEWDLVLKVPIVIYHSSKAVITVGEP